MASSTTKVNSVVNFCNHFPYFLRKRSVNLSSLMHHANEPEISVNRVIRPAQLR